MKLADTGKVVSLMRYPEKKAPAVMEEEMTFVNSQGIEGDHHADGGECQISLLTVQEKEWMQEQEEKGFCFKKYKENILLDGVALSACKQGDLLICGDVILELTSTIKSCHRSLCKMAEKGNCILAGSSRFAKVNKGGKIRVGMDVWKNKQF